MKVSLKQYTRLLAKYLKPQWRQAIALAVLLFSSIGLELLNPQLMSVFIDTAIAGGAAATAGPSAGGGGQGFPQSNQARIFDCQAG